MGDGEVDRGQHIVFSVILRPGRQGRMPEEAQPPQPVVSVTKTTPRLARLLPSYRSALLEPLFSPSPWIQTVTGMGSGPRSAGAQTFRVSQSLLIGRSPTPGSQFEGDRMQIAPSGVASRSPAQASAACSARQRRSTTGGAA